MLWNTLNQQKIAHDFEQFFACYSISLKSYKTLVDIKSNNAS